MDREISLLVDTYGTGHKLPMLLPVWHAFCAPTLERCLQEGLRTNGAEVDAKTDEEACGEGSVLWVLGTHCVGDVGMGALKVCSAKVVCLAALKVCSAKVVCSAALEVCTAKVVCSAALEVCSAKVVCSAALKVCSAAIKDRLTTACVFCGYVIL